MALFAQAGVGSDIATAVLIENRTPYGRHNEYLPKLYQQMRQRNPNCRIAAGFFATSPAPPVWPAQGSAMLPDVVVDPSAPPVSVGSLLYAALTLAESDCRARHLFVVAHTPPTDDADVHPAANRAIVPQLEGLGTMPPLQRWAYLRQKLIQAHTRLHLLIRQEAMAPSIIDLFHGVREAHNDVEVPVWFPVDHANCSLHLSGPPATPGNMPSPPNMLQSPTQDQHASAAIHSAALNPPSLIPHPSQAIPLSSQASLPPQNHSPPMQLQGPPMGLSAVGTVSAPPMLPSAAHAHVSNLQPAQLAAAYATVSAARSRHNSLTHPPQQPPPMLIPSQSPQSQFSNSGLVASQIVQSMHSPIHGHSPPPTAQRSSPPGSNNGPPSLVSYLQSRHGLSRKRGPNNGAVPLVAENVSMANANAMMAMGAGARAKAVAKAAPVIGGVGKKPRVVSGGFGRSASLQMGGIGLKEEDSLASPLLESPIVVKGEDPGNNLFIFPPDEQVRAAHGQIPSFAPPGSGYSPPLQQQHQPSVSPTISSFPSPEQRLKTTPERNYAMAPPPVPQRRTSPPQAQTQMQMPVQASPEMQFAPPPHPPPSGPRRSPPSEGYPPMNQVLQQQQQQQDQFFPPQHPPLGYQKYSPPTPQAQAQAYAQQQQTDYPPAQPPQQQQQQQQFAANSPEDLIPPNEETVPASSSQPAPADTPLMGPGQGFASPQDFMSVQAYANVGGFGLNGFAGSSPVYDAFGTSANGYAAPQGPPPTQPNAVLGGFVAPPPPQSTSTQAANGYSSHPPPPQQTKRSGYATPPNGYRTPPSGYVVPPVGSFASGDGYATPRQNANGHAPQPPPMPTGNPQQPPTLANGGNTHYGLNGYSANGVPSSYAPPPSNGGDYTTTSQDGGSYTVDTSYPGKSPYTTAPYAQSMAAGFAGMRPHVHAQPTYAEDVGQGYGYAPMPVPVPPPTWSAGAAAGY